MGMIAQGKDLWNALFTRTQRQLLSLFFGYPDRSYYANEIVRKAGVGTGSVQRELAKLAGAGLLTVKRVGNQVHYRANRESPIFPELRGIVIKTYGITEQVRSALLALQGEISLALVYGSAMAADDPAINLLLISDDLRYTDVVAGLTGAENALGRNIQPLLFTREEFDRLCESGNADLAEILDQPKVLLMGTLG
ncbi:MAG: transcriptional regulator [Xanthomonadales bacterium]|nr:winged helix-turn-helix transcriptional regulator [Xanthomonadales bacterium]NIX13813.1 transcriptional regulator [Xanthomonadales bacterium]